jgi:hypothetical protein
MAPPGPVEVMRSIRAAPIVYIATQLMGLSTVIASLRNWAFDAWNGVDTRGECSLNPFSVVGDHKAQATYYGGVDAKVLREALTSAAICFSEYVFVDLGSGKGKAVLVAASWPFHRVIGVEFVQEFHEVALQNLQRYRRSKIKCGSICVRLLDASRFEFPEEPLVVCLFNPFNAALLKRVLGNLKTTLKRRPRDIVIIYINPQHESIVYDTVSCTAVKKSKYYTLYRLAGC